MPKKKNKKKKDLIIPRKALAGIAPAIAIIAIIMSKHKPGSLILFLVGIACGIIIGWNYKNAKHNN